MFTPAKMPSVRSPSPKLARSDYLLGIDVTSDSAMVSINRASYAENMIRSTKGVVKKRAGYHTIKTYGGKINGFHVLFGEQNKEIIHVGDKLYIGDTLLYTGVNDVRSTSKQMNGKLYILDGKELLIYDRISVKKATESAYIPTIIIARKPSGGGTTLEPVNLIGRKRKEKFLSDATTKIYQLTANNLDSDIVEVKKLNAGGGWDSLVEGTAFTVNRATGQITFTTAPEKSPSDGIDNIEITYAKTVEGYADKINKCDICTLYGVGGSRDRLFVTGNPKFPNQDYYSQLNDGTYFGDTWYSVLGQDNSKIMGYSIVGDKLAAHKNRSDDNTNIVLRTGTLNNGQAVFALTGALQGSGAISKYSFGVLETEPVFLTNEGIFAVTPSDVIGEKYSQLRSYYINGLLLKEKDLAEAVAIVHEQFYMLGVNGRVYIMDGSQFSYDRNVPFSHRQYECYYWTNINARVFWESGGELFFGTSDGKIGRFDEVLHSDNSIPINAIWDTSDLSGTDFYNRKDYKRLSVLLGSAIATGCKIWAFHSGIKELIRDYDSTARYFSYANFSYSKFSYKTDRTPQELITKRNIKKVKKIKFRFENGLNEPFMLYKMTAEYIESR